MGKLAQAMGVAILGAILNSVYRGQLPALPKGLPPAAETAIQGNVAAAVRVAARLGPQGDSPAAGARAAYVSGMSEVLVICTAIAVVSAVVVAVFLPSTQTVEAAESRGKAPAASGQAAV